MKDVEAAVSGIIEVTGGDMSAVKDVLTSIRNIIEKLGDSKVLTSGTHANGWIHRHMTGVAREVQKELLLKLPDMKNVEAKRVGRIVAESLQAIAVIRTENTTRGFDSNGRCSSKQCRRPPWWR